MECLPNKTFPQLAEVRYALSKTRLTALSVIYFFTQMGCQCRIFVYENHSTKKGLRVPYGAGSCQVKEKLVHLACLGSLFMLSFWLMENCCPEYLFHFCTTLIQRHESLLLTIQRKQPNYIFLNFSS